MATQTLETPAKSPGELVGARIKELREQRGYSQLQLSQMVGVAPIWISNVEIRSKTLPHPTTLRKLASVLGVPIEDLLATAGYIDRDPMWGDIDPRCLAAYRSVPADKKDKFARLILTMAEAIKDE